MYFLIRCGDDGTVVEELSEETLLERITPDKDGEGYYGDELTFLSKIPYNDKGYWNTEAENSAVVIKGEIIVPKPINVVKKYKL